MRVERHQERIADAHRQLQQVQHALHCWHLHMVSVAPEREALLVRTQAFGQCLQMRRMRWAWTVWQEQHKGWLVRKVLTGRAIVHHQLAAKRRRFALWAEHARRRKQERHNVCKALSHWHMRTVRAVLLTWRAWLAEQRHERCVDPRYKAIFLTVGSNPCKDAESDSLALASMSLWSSDLFSKLKHRVLGCVPGMLRHHIQFKVSNHTTVLQGQDVDSCWAVAEAPAQTRVAGMADVHIASVREAAQL